MEGNPYAILLQALRGDTDTRIPVSFRFGTVISADPLQVEAAGTIQEADDLLKNAVLEEFSIGDGLLLVPIESEQRYIILCKVVSV